MSWSAIDSVRKWVGKRKGLLMGLVGLAVEETVNLVPEGSLAVRLVGELTRHGIDRLGNPQADVPDLKPAGQVFPTEQIDQINTWLETLTVSYGALLDRLEGLVAVAEDQPWKEVIPLVKRSLQEHEDLAQQFDSTAQEVRQATLSLARIEERLDEFFHGQQKLALGPEDIKTVLANMPGQAEWDAFRNGNRESKGTPHVDARVAYAGFPLAARHDLFEYRRRGPSAIVRARGPAAVLRGQTVRHGRPRAALPAAGRRQGTGG